MADYVLATLLLVIALWFLVIGWVNVQMGDNGSLLLGGLGVLTLSLMYYLYLFGVFS